MKLLSTKQAAERLGLTQQGIRHLINGGHLKAQLLGREYVILESDLKKLKKPKRGRPKKRAGKGGAK